MNLTCIVFLWLSRIASVLRVVAYSYGVVLTFPPDSVVSSSGDILSLQTVLDQAKPMGRISGGALPSGVVPVMLHALGTCTCTARR